MQHILYSVINMKESLKIFELDNCSKLRVFKEHPINASPYTILVGIKLSMIINLVIPLFFYIIVYNCKYLLINYVTVLNNNSKLR